MRYYHTMVRIKNIADSLKFYCDILGMQEVKRKESKEGRYTLIFLCSDEDIEQFNVNYSPSLELTYNWDPENYQGGRNFGHLAFGVKNIYEICQNVLDNDIIINRPPRDGKMAFIKSPDGISLELLQQGDSLPIKEPWASMKNIGSW
tara:strand:+ start:2573 stop:3013 length:441 start_codon:yes stop_codon:yes gene_type:complete